MKVIDEERIIEDMKRYAPNTQYDAHDYSRYGNEIRLEFLIQDALSLICNLQDENRQLLEKSNDLRDELISAACDLGNAKELIEQQKEEIERLNDMKFTQEHCDLYSENEFLKASLQKQKEEIDRLTAEIDQRREMMHRMDCNYATELQKNTELQKQVDELKFDKEILQKLIDKREKDTAKEILQTIKRAKENGQMYYGEAFMITAQKAYGVEVE